MILLRQRGITADRSNGWGYGTEGWDDGGGGYDLLVQVLEKR